MNKIGNLVYSPDNGIGVIIKYTGNIMEVKYENIRKLYDESASVFNNNLIFLSEDFSEEINSRGFESDYYKTTINKANELDCSLQDIKLLSNDIISAKVKSSIRNSKYTLSFRLNKSKKIKGSCSCPVGSCCKHSYCVLDCLSNFISDSLALECDLNDEYKDLITKVFTDCAPSSFVSNYLAIKKFIKKYKEDKSVSLIYDIDNFVKAKKGRILARDVVTFLSLIDPDLLDSYMMQYRNNDSLLFPSIINSKIYSKAYFFTSIQFYLQGEYQTLFRFSYRNISVDCSDFYNDILEKITFYGGDAEILKNKFSYYKNIDPNVANYILKNIPEEYIEDLINAQNQSFHPDISDLPLTKAITCFRLLKEEDKEKFINEHKESLKLPNNKELFLNEIVKNTRYIAKNNLKKYLKIFDDYNVLYNLILFFCYGINEYVNFKKDKLTLDDFARYVKCDVEYTPHYYSYYSYHDDRFEYSITFIYDNRDYSFDDSSEIDTNLDLDSDYIKKALQIIAINQTKDQVFEIKEKIRKEEERKKREELLKSMKDVMESVNREEKLISQNRLANINQKFNLDVRIKKDHSCNLYIGANKFYKVRDINEFENNFYYHKLIALGKNVNFGAEKENLSESGEKILNLINAYSVSSNYSYAKDTFNFNGVAFDELFKIYDQKFIIFNEQNYFVSNETINFTYSVDENKVLHLLPNVTDCDNLLFGETDIYYFDSNCHRLKVVQDGIKNKKILTFFAKFNEKSIEGIEEEFINTYYNHNEDVIDACESLEFNCTSGIQNINLYFDMEDGILSYKVKVLENELIVDRQSKFNLNTKNNLQTIIGFLTNIGFENNQMNDGEKIYDFLTMDLSPLSYFANIFMSESIKNKNISEFKKKQYRISYHNDLFEVFLEDSEFSNSELEQIYKAIKRKKKFVQLKSKQIVKIDNEYALDFFEMTNELGFDLENASDVQYVPFYQTFKVANSLNDSSMVKYFSEALDSITHFKETSFDIPGINATLRKYQKEGVNWLNLLKKYNLGGILADDMGLGKTLETIAFLHLDETAKPSLIVCPKSLIFNWISEFEKFDKDVKIIKIYGNQVEREAIINNIKKDEKIIYITSYDSLRQDIESYNLEFNYVFLDEAQAIKTVTAKKSISVKQLKADHRFVLTGTPIENNVLELWSIFDFIMPSFFEPIDEFKHRFENEDGYKEKIAKRISLFILRRNKKDVLKDLPDKSERILSAEMSNQQRGIYDAYCKEAKLMLVSQDPKDRFKVIAMLTRLRQICVDPSMFVEDYNGGSGKMDLLFETLDDLFENHHKVLLFSQFVKGLNIVEERLRKNKIPYLILTGDTNAEERLKMCNKFNDEKSNIPIMLISLKAGGNGLNLVGADTVIHLDPWWNVAAENQATDRAYRIGQTKNVEVIKIICENSVEQKVIELQNLKKDLIDSLISNDDNSITRLSSEDVSFLLE